MSAKRIIITASILVLSLGIWGSPAVASQEAESMMCDEGIVEKGDFFQTVQDKCGEPDKKEGQFWRYNFGPSQPVYTIQFDENDKVIRIIEDENGS